MPRRITLMLTLSLILAGGLVTTLVAQAPGTAKGGAAKGGGAKGGTVATGKAGKSVAPRPGLIFKEVWKQNEGGGEQPLAQGNVADSNLTLTIYGCGGEGMQMTGYDNNDANPTHTWSGVCEEPSMFTLKHKTQLADLTGKARVRVNAKISGFHKLHPVVKTADGNWLIANAEIGTTADFLVTELAFSEMRWMRLDAAKVVTKGDLLAEVDLTSIDEIGFADLIPGSGHGAGGWADVAQIEVYGAAKAR